jgi:uncharacterized protein DUF4105
MRLKIIAAVAALLLCAAARAQPPPAAPAETGENLSISVLTFGPGDIYWERFGHNAILLRDSTESTPWAFNYGIFDFNQKNFMLNFARGYMQYRMAADTLGYDLNIYRREGRWVQEQKLNLLPAQRLALRDFLAWNALPQNMGYRYDYFLSNCSTKVRDALDQVLGGALRLQLESTPTPYSYRYDAVRLISPDFIAGVGMDLGLGPRADRPLNLWQESFVPMVLMKALREVKVQDAEGHEQPLVASDERILPGGGVPDDPPAPPDRRLAFLLIGLGLAVALAGLSALRGSAGARIAFAVLASLFSLACGLGGLVLVALWTLTQHWGGWANENLLLLDPLCLLLLPCWLGAMRGRWQPGPLQRRLAIAISLLAALSLLLRLVPGCWQDNLAWIGLVLPGQFALAWAARRRD